MHLTRMRLGRVPPFTDPIELAFDERVNVFIGPNASGKSTLLQAIAEHFLGTDEDGKRPLFGSGQFLREFPGDEFDEYIQEQEESGEQPNLISASEDWFGANNDRYRPEVPPLVVYIGSIREGLPGISSEMRLDTFGGTGEEALSGPFSGSRTSCGRILLSDELIALGKKLKRNGDDTPYKKLVALRDAEKLAGSCSLTICAEVIRNPSLERFIPNRYALAHLRDPHGDPNDIIAQRSIGIRTTDKPNFDNFPRLEQPDQLLYGNDKDAIPIPISHLSSGTEGTFLWVLWLALKMVHHYGFDLEPVVKLKVEVAERPISSFPRRREPRQDGVDPPEADAGAGMTVNLTTPPRHRKRP